MPTLDLPSLHLPEAHSYLAAVMFFPRHPEKHKEIVESIENRALANFLRKRGAPDVIPREVIPNFVRAIVGKKIEEILEAEKEHLYQKTSGDLSYPRPAAAGLFLVYTLASGSSFENTLRKFASGAEVRFVEKADDGRTRGGIYGRSRSTARRIWDDFSPAAHINAITFFMPDLWKMAAESESTLTEFLAYADALRHMGEVYRAARAGKEDTLLDPSETWKVPDWVSLPPIPPMRLPPVAELDAVLATPWSIDQSQHF
jgi:hypothetical protein